MIRFIQKESFYNSPLFSDSTSQWLNTLSKDLPLPLENKEKQWTTQFRSIPSSIQYVWKKEIKKLCSICPCWLLKVLNWLNCHSSYTLVNASLGTDRYNISSSNTYKQYLDLREGEMQAFGQEPFTQDKKKNWIWSGGQRIRVLFLKPDNGH